MKCYNANVRTTEDGILSVNAWADNKVDAILFIKSRLEHEKYTDIEILGMWPIKENAKGSIGRVMIIGNAKF